MVPELIIRFSLWLVLHKGKKNEIEVAILTNLDQHNPPDIFSWGGVGSRVHTCALALHP